MANKQTKTDHVIEEASIAFACAFADESIGDLCIPKSYEIISLLDEIFPDEEYEFHTHVFDENSNKLEIIFRFFSDDEIKLIPAKELKHSSFVGITKFEDEVSLIFKLR